MNVVETLQAERTKLTSKLNEMDERMHTERLGIVAQISQHSSQTAEPSNGKKLVAGDKGSARGN